MELWGYLTGGGVVLCAPGEGRPVVPSEPPSPVPDGYVLAQRWVDAGDAIAQAWSVEPAEGTAESAAVALARMQAASLPDEQAAMVAALFPAWAPNVEYAAGERVLWRGQLYKCLQAHASQAGWEPGEAPSLWARVLPGQSGEVGEWAWPDSTEGYSKGDRVTHGGRVWESLVDANVHEPGTDNGSAWRDVTEGA